MTAWSCAFLLAAAWLVPLHVLPWVSWHSEALAFAAVLLAAWGALRAGWHRAREGVAVPGLALLPLLLAAAALLQWGAGRIAYGGSVVTILLYAALCVAAVAVGYAAAGRGPQPEPALRLLAQLLVALGVLQVFLVFAQTTLTWMDFEGVARTAIPTRGGGNVAQPNQAGLLFVFAIASAVYLRQLGQFTRLALAAVLAALLAGLATTQSRSALLALGVLLAWALWQRRSLPAPVRPWQAAAFGALALALFAAWPVAIAVYLGAGDETLNLTSSGRAGMWAQLLAAVQLRPWTGWGVLQVAEAQNAIAHLYSHVMPATYAHNGLLDVALWVGVPGLLLVLALALRWLAPRLRATLDRDAVYCAALALPFAVQALTEFPYAYSYILAPVLLALGVLEARYGRALVLRLPRSVAAVLLLACTAVAAWSAWEYVRIEEDFRVARFEALRVGQTPQAYDRPPVHVLTQLDALLQATRVQPRPGMPAEELALLRNVAMLHPWGATNFRYATALALNGQLDEASRQLQVLRALQGRAMHERLLQVLDEMAVEYPVLRQLRQP